MLIRKYDIVDWAIALFIVGLLAVATKVSISTILELSKEFHLPF